MDLGLRGKVAVITGGGSGIGRVMAHTFAEEGANVVIADINEKGAKKVAAEVQDRGVGSVAVKSDVGNLDETDKMTQAAMDEFGKIDILVHGAAFFNVKPFGKTTQGEWEKVIRIGLIGAMNCSRSVLDHMISAKSGRIIFIGSDAGRIGDSYQPIYAGAKAGIMAFGKSLAQDVGRHGITVNTVSPALTLTEENRKILKEMYNLDDEKQAKKLLSGYATKRLATSEDIADMVVFLASERAGDVTGQIISVNGGFCMV